mgnify:CR=1 FL=1
METITLDSLKPGDKAIIRGFNGIGVEGSHLMELGLLVGTPVKLIKFAPLGDPLEICFRGYHLSFRCSVAKSIFVEKING